MVHLTERISSSAYRDLVFPVASVNRLLIFQTEDWDFYHEMLLIEYDSSRQMFRFEFFERPNIKAHWKKECSVAEGYSAFIHFLKLKNWFPVIELPKGT